MGEASQLLSLDQLPPEGKTLGELVKAPVPRSKQLASGCHTSHRYTIRYQPAAHRGGAGKVRINARGEIVRPLDVAKATALIEDLCSSGIEALTISLMHAYANPEHERRLRDIVAERFPDIPVSLSSDILPEFREYDRAITTVMNDYVRPIMKRYLSRIEERLKHEQVKARLHIVRSDGGLMSATAASERPVHTVLSGPAGGVTSTVMIARRTGFKKLLAFDMGGTSTDVSVILDGEPTISRSTEVGYFPAKVPTLDVRSVGAGGGSIAEVSELTKSLRVGPRSAGAKPGPVAYGLGGVEPTVSDANVVLGYLPPALLGGDMALDVAGAKAAIAKVGQAMGLSAEDAAKGIIDIANEVMLGALRVITVQRGLDPRDFGIVAFGGAGPLHANALAELLGCYPVLVPPSPGVLSALASSRPSSRTSSCRPSFGRRSASMHARCGRVSPRSAKRPKPGSTSRRSPKATAPSAIRSICATSNKGSR